MSIDFLFAENIENNKIRIYIDVDGETKSFDVSEFLLLNDIKKL